MTGPAIHHLQVTPDDVAGNGGRGIVDHFGLHGKFDVEIGTLSKAFGAFGGAILGSARLRQQILDHSRMFVGSTPLPLPLANAALRVWACADWFADCRRERCLTPSVSVRCTPLRCAAASEQLRWPAASLRSVPRPEAGGDRRAG